MLKSSASSVVGVYALALKEGRAAQRKKKEQNTLAILHSLFLILLLSSSESCVRGLQIPHLPPSGAPRRPQPGEGNVA